MQLYSTQSPQQVYSFGEAVLKGLPADNGLFMPVHIGRLPKEVLDGMASYSFAELSVEVAKVLLEGAIPAAELERIVQESVNFAAPLAQVREGVYALELFHGPSLAFKDFGARFMARVMAYFDKDADRPLNILVATSGDTGGAVAAGFYRTPGIRVVVLYPSGKVSHLQEQQLTTLGHNIHAVEVQGTFDDCQALVKQAFLDADLQRQYRLTSANSINIARLIPQAFYYFEAYKQLLDKKDVVVSVPSGNFGNLTAGLIAKRMGLPIGRFLAATNVNDTVPAYLKTGIYTPKASVPTYSNAMDVGNPSNFVRMLDLYKGSVAALRQDVVGYAFSDAETLAAMRRVYEQDGYILDPHGAVGYLALEAYARQTGSSVKGIFLETAHPSKFIDTVSAAIGTSPPIPERLAALADKKKEAELLSADFDTFKNYLLSATFLK